MLPLRQTSMLAQNGKNRFVLFFSFPAVIVTLCRVPSCSAVLCEVWSCRIGSCRVVSCQVISCSSNSCCLIDPPFPWFPLLFQQPHPSQRPGQAGGSEGAEPLQETSTYGQSLVGIINIGRKTVWLTTAINWQTCNHDTRNTVRHGSAAY